ncbi:MAG TPA: hypothetical protein VLM11_15745 [Streptosporangiaceae bacterium]|nr:hypothetical protein [Streptosporangiaceae bacterium]
MTDQSQPEAPQPGGAQPDNGASRPQRGNLPQHKPLGESLPQRGGSPVESSSAAYGEPPYPASRGNEAAGPSGEVLARLRDALIDSDDTLPRGSDEVPQSGADQWQSGGQLPQRGEPLPQRAPDQAAGNGSPLPQRGGALPQRGGDLPQRGGALPQRGGDLPQRGGDLPLRSGALPQRGGDLPLRSAAADGPSALPRRTTRTRPSGRHRSPHRLSVASDAPALVLAVPGSAEADTSEIGPRVVGIAELSCPGVDIRIGYVQGADLSLTDALMPPDVDGDAADHSQFPSVIVPLLLGPSPAIDAKLSEVAARPTVPAVVAGHLGPHPLVAEALHARLAEAGLARHARSAGLSITADHRGIIVLADKDEQAASAAAVAAVLLASRLSVPVVPASLGDPASIADAVTRLSDLGSRPALAPCLIGPETSLEVLDDLSAALGAPASATLGAHRAVGQLVAIRYGAALASLSLAR